MTQESPQHGQKVKPRASNRKQSLDTTGSKAQTTRLAAEETRPKTGVNNINVDARHERHNIRASSTSAPLHITDAYVIADNTINTTIININSTS